MHDITDTPYIIGAIGFFSMFSANESRPLMSTSSQTPSSLIAERIVSIIPTGSVMSWMQSNVVMKSTDRSLGIGSRRALWNPAFASPFVCS